ncbi:hypothetical protein CALCODRAFT_519509 [Calocera cornea HHB12733]|uniref:HMG box domain-containing protein n=1 Tax=Calocera cornea HHB12733 TaxID=1353952 RepID=A0A165E7B1_9BASI|nr:hypothetical protein CALCODRAFT_519509 [Calocera cornea HHB12733]
MFAALLPRIFVNARVAIAPRAFAVSRVLPLTPRPLLFPSRSFAATATATKRSSTSAKATSTRASGRPKGSTTGASKKAAPKTKRKKAATKKKPLAKKLAKKKPAKKTKKAKPKAPKVVLPKPPNRGATTYGLFVKENFSKMGKPNMTRDEFFAASQALGAEWKALSDAEKQKYQQASDKSRKEGHLAFLEWAQGITPAVLRKINKQRRLKKKVQLRLPRHTDVVKPTNPFMIFVADQRALPESWEGAPTEGRAAQIWFARRSGEQWRSLSDTQKAPYFERTARHNAAYKAQASV